VVPVFYRIFVPALPTPETEGEETMAAAGSPTHSGVSAWTRYSAGTRRRAI